MYNITYNIYIIIIINLYYNKNDMNISNNLAIFIGLT